MGTVLLDSEIRQALETLPGWRKNGNVIQRVFEFPDFAKAMELVNKVAAAAEASNHHPDILINYNKVTFTLVTHSAGGLTGNDFALARQINDLG